MPAKNKTNLTNRFYIDRYIVYAVTIFFLVLFLIGAYYLWEQIGPNVVEENLGEGTDGQKILAVSQETEALPSLDPGQEGAVQLPIVTSNEPVLTPSKTSLPLPMRVPLQVWRMQTEIAFKGHDSLENEWRFVPERDWEYGFSNHKGEDGLFIQFSKREILLHNNGVDHGGIDREITLALLNHFGSVTFACFTDSNRELGYYFILSQQSFKQIWVTENGSQQVLELPTPQEFQDGEFTTFKIICRDKYVTFGYDGLVWPSVDRNFDPPKSSGIIFDPGEGEGVVVVKDDTVYEMIENTNILGIGDIVWMDHLKVKLSAVLPDEKLTIPGYHETRYVVILVEISDQADFSMPVQRGEIFLVKNGQKMLPIEIFTIDPQSRTQGGFPFYPPHLRHEEFYIVFPRISENELTSWMLVIDHLEYGARFNLGE